MDMPSINTDENILKSEMNLGDAILFNFKVLHSSSGNETNRSRRAFSMRFIGDDVKYLGRGGETSPPFKGIDLKDGERMRKDWFPVVWNSWMKKILFLLTLSILICTNSYAKKNIKKELFYSIIKEKGYTGFVLRYHNEKNPNEFEVVLPPNSPPIISDYRSRYGVLGGSRSKPKKHGGIDFYQAPGE